MKTPITLLHFALCLAALSCKSGGETGERNMLAGNLDAQVDKLLGGKDVYADATRVIPVLVNSEQGSGDKKEHLESYAITKKGKVLTPAQIARLQTVIFSKDTYDFNVAKKCMFQPYVGFIFEKSGKQAHALFCFSCNEVSFGRDSKQGNIEDFDAARKEMLALAREVFPGDAALANLGAGK